jgi:hypothetical protein
VRAGLALVAGAVAAAALAGCGGHSDRKQVAAYIQRVDVVEGRLAAPLREITLANRSFAGKHPDPAAIERRIAKARVRVAAAERQLKAIDPPPRAAHLQELLVRLVEREDELAGELQQLAGFVPAFARAVQPLAGTSTTLRQALASKTPNAQKAVALRAYAARLSFVALNLGTLVSPPATKPTLAAQASTLEHVQAAAVALAAALERKQTKRVPALLRRLDVAAVGNRTLTAQRAEIAAIRAYDGRIRSLSTLAAAIGKERVKLSNG